MMPLSTLVIMPMNFGKQMERKKIFVYIFSVTVMSFLKNCNHLPLENPGCLRLEIMKIV